jgi:hypothetical protein
MVQATMHSGMGKKRDELRLITWPECCDVEVWRGRPDGTIAVYSYSAQTDQELYHVGNISKDGELILLEKPRVVKSLSLLQKKVSGNDNSGDVD